MTPTIAEIKAATAAHFGLTTIDLESARRDAALVRARHVAMWLARALTRHTLTVIAQKFGDRDHTSVWYAVGRINDEFRNDAGAGPHVCRLLLAFADRTGVVEGF